MDMKKILQAFEGASTKPVEGANSMAKFLRVVKEADMNQPPKGVNLAPEYLQKVASGQGGKSLISPEMAQAALDWLAANPNYTPPAPVAKPVAAEPTQTLSQHYQANPNIREGLQGNGLIKQYFESVQTESSQALAERRAKIKEQARRIAQRMREDAKVSAVDQAKKTITYTDDKTGISTTIPQAMAKPGEGGQVMVDKSQVNQAVGQDQQQAPAVKVGDMIKMLDTESSSAGVRMQRALQREKERREYSQRYAEKNFPIGKKPEPIKEPVKDEGILSFMSKDKPVKKKPQALDPYAAKLLANRHQNKPPAPKSKVYQGPEEYRKEKDMSEGNEDPLWMNNLRLRK